MDGKDFLRALCNFFNGFKWLVKKHYVAKILQFERHLYMKMIVFILSTNLVTNLFLSFRNQKQESIFEQVVPSNCFVFCL